MVHRKQQQQQKKNNYSSKTLGKGEQMHMDTSLEDLI